MTSKIDELLAFLPTFWMKDENSNNYKFFKSFADVLETVGTNITGLRASIHINSATGRYLDDLAALFKIYRETEETDESLRIKVLNFWSSLNRGGLIQNLVKIFAELLGIEETEVSYVEEDAAVIRLIGNLGGLNSQINIADSEEICEILNSIKAAGVYLQILYSPLIEETWSEAFDDSEILIVLSIDGLVGDFYVYDGEGELI
jgi:soluble P-type ATPase